MARTNAEAAVHGKYVHTCFADGSRSPIRLELRFWVCTKKQKKSPCRRFRRIEREEFSRSSPIGIPDPTRAYRPHVSPCGKVSKKKKNFSTAFLPSCKNTPNLFSRNAFPCRRAPDRRNFETDVKNVNAITSRRNAASCLYTCDLIMSEHLRATIFVNRAAHFYARNVNQGIFCRNFNHVCVSA